MAERLSSTDELLAARPDDVYLRGQVAPGRTDVPAWAGEGAVCFLATRAVGRPAAGGRPAVASRLVGLGRPAGVARLVRSGLAELPAPPPGFTVERAAYPLLAASLPTFGVDAWDFQWTDTPPPRLAAERQAAWLADAAATEISELLAAASPRHDVEPGEPHVRRWAGLRDADGALAACAADTRRYATGVAHLASVATAPARRGQGLGAAVTSWTTRRILAEGDEVCTLSLYADNEPAKRLYRRLGYREEHHFASGAFG